MLLDTAALICQSSEVTFTRVLLPPQTVSVKPTFIVPLMGAVGVSSAAQALKFGADTSLNTLMNLGQVT